MQKGKKENKKLIVRIITLFAFLVGALFLILFFNSESEKKEEFKNHPSFFPPIETHTPTQGGEEKKFVLLPPQNLKCEIIDFAIKLSWRVENDNQRVFYNIYKKSEDEKEFKKIAEEISGNEYFDKTYTDPYLEYSYYVTSKDKEGNESKASNIIKCKINQEINPPISQKRGLKILQFFKRNILDIREANAASCVVNPDSTFNPNKLIEDNDFININSMSVNEIQLFLEKYNSPLANKDPSFLKRLCGTPVSQCNNTKTAAQLIYEAATLKSSDGKQLGVNPGVILVTLQKEQSLITKTSWDDSCPAGNKCPAGTLQYALDWAMGYAVYENGTRIEELKGFRQQLLGIPNSWWGAPRSLRYNYEIGRGPDKCGENKDQPCYLGDSFILSNTTTYYCVPSSQTVKPTNKSTMALYRYTPHVFNGNYNFWYYWENWFVSIYKIETFSQISFSPGTNWYYVDGNMVWVDFGVINKNKSSIQLERIKVDIYGDRGTQDIYGVSNYILGPGEKFVLSESNEFRTKIFKYPGMYTAQIWIKYKGKWYQPIGAQNKKFRVIPVKPEYFALNPSLTIFPSIIKKGQSVTGEFIIYNKTSAPVFFERLKIDLRDGSKIYDIWGWSNFALDYSFRFSQSRTVDEVGVYKGNIKIKINGNWFSPSGNIQREIKVLEK